MCPLTGRQTVVPGQGENRFRMPEKVCILHVAYFSAQSACLFPLSACTCVCVCAHRSWPWLKHRHARQVRRKHVSSMPQLYYSPTCLFLIYEKDEGAKSTTMMQCQRMPIAAGVLSLGARRLNMCLPPRLAFVFLARCSLSLGP
ncbi:hypothetical protein LZ31DRAFT_346713 [Colletotrichum somersetense]|nr:hypothetical protein LZ31DRAFT_346713 [Colletotrichum somersetense]